MEKRGRKNKVYSEDLLECSCVARSRCCYYRNQDDTDKYEEVKAEIIKTFNSNKGRYDYRRMMQVLKGKGYTINHKAASKLMNSLGLKGKQRKDEKYHSYRDEVGKILDNVLKGKFNADKPYEKLTTDVRQIKVCAMRRCTCQLYFTQFHSVQICNKSEICSTDYL